MNCLLTEPNWKYNYCDGLLNYTSLRSVTDTLFEKELVICCSYTSLSGHRCTADAELAMFKGGLGIAGAKEGCVFTIPMVLTTVHHLKNIIKNTPV